MFQSGRSVHHVRGDGPVRAYHMFFIVSAVVRYYCPYESYYSNGAQCLHPCTSHRATGPSLLAWTLTLSKTCGDTKNSLLWIYLLKNSRAFRSENLFFAHNKTSLTQWQCSHLNHCESFYIYELQSLLFSVFFSFFCLHIHSIYMVMIANICCFFVDNIAVYTVTESRDVLYWYTQWNCWWGCQTSLSETRFPQQEDEWPSCLWFRCLWGSTSGFRGCY